MVTLRTDRKDWVPQPVWGCRPRLLAQRRPPAGAANEMLSALPSEQLA